MITAYLFNTDRRYEVSHYQSVDEARRGIVAHVGAKPDGRPHYFMPGAIGFYAFDPASARSVRVDGVKAEEIFPQLFSQQQEKT